MLAVRNTARFTPAIFPKGKDQRHDWEIFREIALRTTSRLTKKKTMAKALTERVAGDELLQLTEDAVVCAALETVMASTAKQAIGHALRTSEGDWIGLIVLLLSGASAWADWRI